MVNRRFVATAAVWCREIAIPAVVFAVLVAASSLANDVYSLAVADVTPATPDIAPLSASLPLSTSLSPSSEQAMAAINPVAAREADDSNADAANVDALKTDAPAATEPAKTESAKTEPANTEPAKTELVAAPTVMAALETPEEQLPPRSINESSHPNDAVGPKTDEVFDATGSPEIVDECLVMEICVDRYLWQLYQRTPKEDSVKESTQRKVTIKKKGKLITVTRTSTTVVDEDFGWKDPKAAAHAGMPLSDYVIGGVDRDFKLKLFQMLRAAEQAGLAPGITSAFRDDYRQSIASGLKAADNRSYHGGSLRGGYGHGLAADIVSIKGATRRERLVFSEILWKWVDDHGSEFGIGRPYLDRDPPHVAPIDGEEFARHRPGVRTRQATAAAN